jgi:Kef-type K+ transport system membrane component KefB
MKIKLSLIFYLSILGMLAAVIFFVFNAGRHLELLTELKAGPGIFRQHPVMENIRKIPGTSITVILTQLIIIILASVFLGAVFNRIGQPKVIGEIVAGIILGPSLLGSLLPGVSNFIFPAASFASLQMLSQLGLILFMFIIGMEVDPGIVRKKIPSALVISHASIAIPFGLGIILSYFLYRKFAPENVPFYAFSLFIGIAMSITAFPVLASIIREKGLSGTRLGNIAITCAATDDITAWCLLAIVLSAVTGVSAGASLNILLLTIVYVGGMLLLIRPLMKKLFSYKANDGKINGPVLALIFALLFLSACCSELIGIHVLFGAFIAGISMPARADIRCLLIGKIESFSLILLPLFFAYTGLRTRIGQLDDPMLWLTCIAICMVAIAGKFGGSAIAARIMGESVHDSLAIGALMNTRGLVELIVLNIGYDIGILSPRLFTMLVLMALVTTFLTSPALVLIGRIKNNL